MGVPDFYVPFCPCISAERGPVCVEDGRLLSSSLPPAGGDTVHFAGIVGICYCALLEGAADKHEPT